MKKLFTLVLIAIFSTFMLYGNSINANNTSEKSITIKCREMSCEGCKREITRSIKTLDGIINIDVNLETHLIKVSFDDSKTTSKQILNAITDVGYDSELVE